MVLADFFKRWHVLRGVSDAKLLTGTDEHGLKVRSTANQPNEDMLTPLCIIAHG